MPDQPPVILEGREHVRKRPGMYIGGTDLIALHHFAYEILDSSLEEATMGRCNHIEIELHPQQQLVIQDNSQGLPIGWHEKHNSSFIEALFTQIGTYKTDLDHYTYTVVGGLHGVGLAAINPLCKSLHVAVKREGYLWQQSYREGLPKTPLLKTPLPESDLSTGTRITLQPDFTIMQPNEFSYEILQRRCQELAYLTPGLRLTLRDFRADALRSESFFEADGLASYVRQMNPTAIKRFGVIQGEGMMEVHRDDTTYQVAVAFALQLTDAPESQVLSYINSVKSPESGFLTEGVSQRFECSF
jgi:DNA gyrase subunit B